MPIPLVPIATTVAKTVIADKALDIATDKARDLLGGTNTMKAETTGPEKFGETSTPTTPTTDLTFGQ